jgi:antitoxin (DNA-binding transcriptional repressor) of toxin-antitoxin stability system
MHEAKTRLSELVKAVETQGETVILCRNGLSVAEIRSHPEVKEKRELKVHPELAGKLLYDPTEPASDDEWPEEFR